jgi:hypothetical protein
MIVPTFIVAAFSEVWSISWNGRFSLLLLDVHAAFDVQAVV